MKGPVAVGAVVGSFWFFLRLLVGECEVKWGACGGERGLREGFC